MNKIYFKAGEEVILQCTRKAELNGDHVVAGVAITRGHEGIKCPFTGVDLYYEDTGNPVVFLCGVTKPGGRAITFKQKVIKKKYKGGQSLKSLMKNLNRVTS